MTLGEIAGKLGLEILTPELSVNGGAEVGTGHASDLLSDVLANAPSGGLLLTIQVRIDRAGMYVTVAVKDDGIGMSPEDCTKVFDEFYRVRGEHTASIPGTGLGLSLVKRLTELHEGKVTLASVLGQGSEFTVSIPALPCLRPALALHV